MGERLQRSAGDRVIDTPAGTLLGVSALVPLALGAGAVVEIVEGNARLSVVVGGLVSLAVFVWCLRTSWRLVSGRPRNDGGLLSPWLIAAAGVAFAAWGSSALPTSGGRGWVARCGWEPRQSVVSPSPGNGFGVSGADEAGNGHDSLRYPVVVDTAPCSLTPLSCWQRTRTGGKPPRRREAVK